MHQLRILIPAAFSVFMLGLLIKLPAAEARGGGSSFMNSPGYQRRLQESRGYVTNQSGSLVAPAVSTPPRAHIKSKRHRH